MNKRGDIPITILVIGIFAVCTLAILSFFASNINTRNSFVGVVIIENLNLQIEENLFFDKEISNLYLEKIKPTFSPGFNLDWVKDELLFSVEYASP